jgi:hypothetical protein
MVPRLPVRAVTVSGLQHAIRAAEVARLDPSVGGRSYG